MNNDAIKQDLRAYISSVLGENIFTEINDDSSLLESRLLDSVNTLQLVSHMEEKYKIDVNAHEITNENFDSVNRMINFINEKLS